MNANPYHDAPRLAEGPSVDPRLLVGAGTAPIELEIGPGRGGFLFERLDLFPEVRMLGLEVRLKWAKIVDDRLRQRGLGDRGRVFAEDAGSAIPRFPDACISAVFVHFPDPWWKKRHEKRLVLQSTLLSQLARVVIPGGELFIQTDVEERAERYAAIVAGCADFEPLTPGVYSSDHPYGARSPRERRAMTDGLPIFRLRYCRTGAATGAVPVCAAPAE